MSLGVNLASRDLLTAYQSVLNGDPNTDWCLFTYEKGSNDLKVQDTGSGGLAALEEEFSDGRGVEMESPSLAKDFSVCLTLVTL
ncbi:hypothetical protein FRC08_013363 [Ceratobasidium sp. 394]|nr:hypothetical protein FRC08_013363 [Ceratobasidium sp. 394]